ncbi:MAG: hypothetical protein PHR64_02390, partial [Candidatus Shapirobacteria bacterium]|nr:hypothetical protein [Candidatus Shapirobacteria bacterium]MDD5481772.1 hypothetical protein [Candidatus Shapirobacteria bacterium]
MIKKIKVFGKGVGQLALRFPLWTMVIFFFLSLFFLYLPFIFHLSSFWGLAYQDRFNFATILLNFDSLNYIIAAKTWYVPEQITGLFPGIAEPAHYFPAHFPLYPALIWLLAQLPLVNYPYAAILVTIISSLTAIAAFYYLAKLILGEKKALILSLVFLVFPARWLIIRAVPSPEPLFLTTILAAIYFFKKEAYGKSAILTIIAQTIKSPGVLLAGALGLITLIKIYQNKNQFKATLKKYWPMLITPTGLLLVFFFYLLTTGDFLMYFKTGNNIHLYWPPFQVFNYLEEWVRTIWLEDVVFIYLAGLILLFRLWEKYRFDILLLFPAIFYLSVLFVSHRDISRYLLPAMPFLLIGGEKFFTNKKFLLPLILL